MEHQALFIVILGGVVLYLVWDTYFMGKQEWVKSTYDNKSYLVQSRPDKLEAANLLAHIAENLTLLSKHLEKTTPDDYRTQQIIMNFKPEKISEGTDREDYTSYAVNKGESIVFCLRQKEGTRPLLDLNTMMFVALHELTHIGTESIGHTPEFWDNFKWILHNSIDIGIYSQQDFKTKPKKYCGIMIESSPLDGERSNTGGTV
uniref:WLM domain-containing protein n=1 Tax=viral metagenome TaxID=1070528 RepID=A0A6C0KSM9_9ZZZZ